MTEPSSTIRVLVADDQSLVRGALVALLNTETDIEVVAETGTGADVAALAAAHRVDVAVLDIEMPEVNGIEAAAEVSTHHPSTRSLIVTTFGRPGYLKRALAAGASGFLVKDTPPAQLAEAIRRVARGLRAVDPAIAEESLFVPDNPLTAREVEVCKLVLAGLDPRQIAARMHLSYGTVRNMLSSITSKTGAAHRSAAVETAERNGWL